MEPEAGRAANEERRRNFELRERVDEVIHLARELSRRASGMSPRELEEAAARLEWLAEEIWESATQGPLEDRVRRGARDEGV
jgi:hypothetical protein